MIIRLSSLINHRFYFNFSKYVRTPDHILFGKNDLQRVRLTKNQLEVKELYYY